MRTSVSNGSTKCFDKSKKTTRISISLRIAVVIFNKSVYSRNNIYTPGKKSGSTEEENRSFNSATLSYARQSTSVNFIDKL